MIRHIPLLLTLSSLLLAVIVATFATPWATLNIGYKIGGLNIWGGQTFRRLQNWLSNTTWKVMDVLEH